MSRDVRRWVVAVALATASAFVVWNGVFGLHVSRGEKQYLLEEARHRLGERSAPSMSDIMAATVREGARQASWAAAVVFGLHVAAIYAARRR